MIRSNIDTDTIIPSREMRHVSKQGLGEGLFAGWRYLKGDWETRAINPDFVLNKPQYGGAMLSEPMVIDLQNSTVAGSAGLSYRFDIEPVYRDMLQGMDAIDMTLQHQDMIDEFQSKDRQTRNWVYLR